MILAFDLIRTTTHKHICHFCSISSFIERCAVATQLGRSKEFLVFSITLPRWTNHTLRIVSRLSHLLSMSTVAKKELSSSQKDPNTFAAAAAGSPWVNTVFCHPVQKSPEKKTWYNFSLVLKRCSSMYVGASASISDESRYYTTLVLEQPSKNGLSTT